MWGKQRLSPPWNTKLEEYFFQKLTQFSQRNSVLHSSASNTDGFPSRDTCVSSTRLNWWICNKTSLFQLEKFDLQEVLFSKTNWVLTENNVLDVAASFIDVFLWRGTCISPNHLNRHIWSKQNLFPPWKSLFAGSILFQNYHDSHRKQCTTLFCFKHGWFSLRNTCVSST
jgi:hypothetical protein